MWTNFWDAVIVVAIVILVVAVIELWERVRTRRPSADNTFEQARQDRIDAANLAAFFPPTPKTGPGGFAAQGDRRAHTAHVQQIRSRKVN